MLYCFFELNLQRFANPFVLLGIFIVLCGVLLMIFAKHLASYINKSLSKKGKMSSINIEILMKILSLGLTVIGALIAVLLL